MFIVCSCLGLLSCIELDIFLCCLVLFVSTLAKWVAGKTYTRDIFRVEWFPLQRPDWRAVYCNGLLYVFPTCNIFNFLINFTFLTATYLLKAWYSLFLLKVPLNFSQSIQLPCSPARTAHPMHNCHVAPQPPAEVAFQRVKCCASVVQVDECL